MQEASTQKRQRKTTKKTTAKKSTTVAKKPQKAKPKTAKPVAKKTAVKKTVKRAPKVEQNPNKTVALKCCSILSKSMSKNVFDDWEEIGFGEESKSWLQIRGLMNGNNIAISKHDVGRKKKYTMYLVSKQGTDVEFCFNEFKHVNRGDTLMLIFSNGTDVIKHEVSYGGIDG